MPRPARRFAAIEPSATFAVLETVRELRGRGVDVLDLGGGEPDFATPEHVVASAVEALHTGRTHYTPSRGLPELRAAIAAKLATDNGIQVDPATDVIVTPSAKHALFLAMLGALDPGDEIILPAPCWVSYPEMVRLIGARPVFAETRLPAEPGAEPGTGEFQITGRALRAARTDRTRAILINSPGNPTGHALDAAEAREIADFAVEHDLIIITDEIYEMIRYRRPHLSMAAQPGCAERTLTVNGLSKAHAMTGWRLGYVAGPTGLIGELVKAQQHTVGCAGSFVQAGGVAALTGPQDHVAAMTAEYAARAELLVDGLNALPGVRCAHPEGAFYAFPDISGTGFASSADFADWLLRTAAVAVTPGSAFGPGGEGHVRLSFATSPQVLKEAVDRMAAALHGR